MRQPGLYRRIEPSYTIPVCGEWKTITEAQLREMKKDSVYYDLDWYIGSVQANPMAFFLPHGNPRKDRHGNDGAAFLNDWTNDLLVVQKPNQCGGTTLGAIRVAMHLCKCDPKWLIFTEGHVDYHEWTGPKTAIVCSYEWSNTYDMWMQAYRKWLPRAELGPYAAGYGQWFDPETEHGKMFRDETEPERHLPAGFKSGVAVLPLKNGSRIIWLCYKQSVSAATGKQGNVIHLDEQAPEDFADELMQRQTTMGDYHPVIITMTPHVIDGRPDTGANGWVYRKLQDRGVTKGRKIAFYRIGMDDVPDSIIGKSTKREKYVQWVEEPELHNDDKKRREGRARYYGEPQTGGGIIISAWNPDIHVIEPFNWRKYKPTLYRYVDHGQCTCAGLIVAVMPWGDHVWIAEHYRHDGSIGVNSQEIVEDLCENERVKVEEFTHDGQTWPIYEERFKGMEFYASELDGRSFETRSQETGRRMGQAYNDYGLTCSPSPNPVGEDPIEMLCEYFELDRSREHINARLKRPVPDAAVKFGSPRCYLFSTLANARVEIEHWCRNPKTNKPVDKDDHLLSCWKWHCCRDRPYMGDWNSGEQSQGAESEESVLSDEIGY